MGQEEYDVGRQLGEKLCDGTVKLVKKHPQAAKITAAFLLGLLIGYFIA